MTEHAPDVETNTTYKTRQEQEHEERRDWMGAFAPTAAPVATSTTPGGARPTAITRATAGVAVGASRPSGTKVGIPLPTAPASSKSPRTSHFRKNRAAAAAVVSQGGEQPPRPAFFGPTKEVVH